MKKIKPSELRANASLHKLYNDKDWHKFKQKPCIPLGYEVLSPIDNLVFALDDLYFNLLVGGKERSEKNDFFHCAIITLLKTSKKENLKFILIGKKKSELALYEKMPHLLFPFVSNFDYVKEAIQWCLSEIDRRLQLSCEHTGTFNKYNKELKEKLPRIVVIIEELDSLMKNDPKFYKNAFEKINMLSSLVNMHFIVGIAKPSNIKIVPKKITKGFFYRITFATTTSNDSIIMTGDKGAEKLKNKEMLYSYDGRAKEGAVHLGGYFINKKEIKNRIKNFS